MGKPLNASGTAGTFVELDGRAGGKGYIPNAAIALSQPQGSDAVWRLKIMARLEGGGLTELGTIRCKPTNFDGAKPNRVVAIVSCPGAKGWLVHATLISGTPKRSEILDISATECCGDAGIRVFERVFYETISGVSGVANVPADYIVTGISAFAAAGVSTGIVSVASMANPVPEGGAIELAPPYDFVSRQGSLVGPVAVTFTDTAGYTIEVLN